MLGASLGASLGALDKDGALEGALDNDGALEGALDKDGALEGALDKDGALDGALDKDGALDGTCALANGTAAAKQRMTTAMDSFIAIGWTRAFVDGILCCVCDLVVR